MTRLIALMTVLTAALGLAPAVLAQQPSETPELPPTQAEQQATEVSDADIETFATIYVELQETATRFEEEMAAVESEEEAQEVQTRMQKESIEKLEKHGWTPDRFNRVAQAVNQNPALVEKTLQLIEEKS